MSNLKGTMQIIFRADGSRDIGLGHIVRCLTLAEELKNRDSSSDILFITGHKQGQEIIEKRGYRVVGTQTDEILQIKELGSSGTLLITDFLDTDNAYISQIKSSTDIRVIAIDNNTRLKRIDANVVINANVFDEGETRVIGSTTYYLGPKYMILRREFDVANNRVSKLVRDKVESIIVVSGGADFAGGQLTLSSVKALDRINTEVHISVIVGPAFSYNIELEELLSKARRSFNTLYSPPNLVIILRSADLAITAAGITLYELATLGVPSIVIPQMTSKTRHQEDIANAFERYKACVNLGTHPNDEMLYKKIEMLVNDKSLREQLSINSRLLVDGKGLQRALELIQKISN